MASQPENMDATVPPDFFEKLQALYQNKPDLRDYWLAEGPVLTEIAPQVAKAIAFNYVLESPLSVGGSGVLAIVRDVNLRARRVLKISRPSPGKDRLLARILTSETESLRRLSHQKLIRIFAQGAATAAGQDYPFYVMDYVEGVLDSDKYPARTGRSEHEVLGIFDGVLSGVEYLHQQKMIHMDLKPSNILVTPTAVPIVSDLGFAKQLRLDEGYRN